MCCFTSRILFILLDPFSAILFRREQDSDSVGGQQVGHDGGEAGLHLAAGGILREVQGEQTLIGTCGPKPFSVRSQRFFSYLITQKLTNLVVPAMSTGYLPYVNPSILFVTSQGRFKLRVLLPK